MAITGLCLIGFLLMHMFGNSKLLLPDDGKEFNEYAHYLRHLLYPILPPYLFLWLFRIFLLVCLVLHMWSAFELSGRKSRSVGRARYANTKHMESSYAARTMMISGPILLLGLILHLLQYTAQVLKVGYSDTNTEPFTRVMLAYQEWWVWLAYVIFMAAVCMHVYHGFASAFFTLGANTSVKARSVLKGLSALIAVLLFVGFLFPPTLILLGVIG